MTKTTFSFIRCFTLVVYSLICMSIFISMPIKSEAYIPEKDSPLYSEKPLVNPESQAGKVVAAAALAGEQAKNFASRKWQAFKDYLIGKAKGTTVQLANQYLGNTIQNYTTVLEQAKTTAAYIQQKAIVLDKASETVLNLVSGVEQTKKLIQDNVQKVKNVTNAVTDATTRAADEVKELIEIGKDIGKEATQAVRQAAQKTAEAAKEAAAAAQEDITKTTEYQLGGMPLEKEQMTPTSSLATKLSQFARSLFQGPVPEHELEAEATEQRQTEAQAKQETQKMEQQQREEEQRKAQIEEEKLLETQRILEAEQAKEKREAAGTTAQTRKKTGKTPKKEQRFGKPLAKKTGTLQSQATIKLRQQPTQKTFPVVKKVPTQEKRMRPLAKPEQKKSSVSPEKRWWLDVSSSEKS